MASPLLGPPPLCTSPPQFRLRRLHLHRWPRPIRAVVEWREYEDAVKEKDLARALRLLRSSSLIGFPSSSRPRKDWEVLDTCLNADDMRLVASAYAFLQDQGLLPSFGSCRNIVLEGPREVTPTVLKEFTGLEGKIPAPLY